VDPGPEEPHDWLTLSLGGRDGGCWIPSADEAKVMAALADFEAHFNVDQHRVFLGGYSSGGDLAYRAGFRHSSSFAGLLIENSSPFRDTESTQAESLAAATTKFHIAHLAHTEDDVYPIAEVKSEINAVKAAGFPLELIEKSGEHYDSHTESDRRKYLLPFINAGWISP
jgi:predicted esterase